jgi:multiple sugar transport system ATP-binding protein
MASVALRDIWKRFGEVQALRGVSFECKDGESFCLLGPSGAGKTTTIRVIAGIETPEKGEVLLDNKPISGLLPQQRDVAVAFESYALYPQLTVFENLAFPLRAPIRASQYTEDEVKKRVDEVANMLGIGDLLARYPRQLSGGQRQRAALGRALVRRPKVYLLDEPIAHLDAKLRHRMRGELRKIQTELGITTIYATPDQLEALSMADTIAVINKGKVEQIGTPDDIYDRPANVFVGCFVGDPPMNILTTVLDAETLVVHSDGSFQVPIPSVDRPLLLEQVGRGELKVGIRPKDIQLVAESAEIVHARGRVKDIDTLGQTTAVIVMVGSAGVKVKVPTAQAPDPGSNVGLVLDTSKFHYFDARTDQRIGVGST